MAQLLHSRPEASSSKQARFRAGDRPRTTGSPRSEQPLARRLALAKVRELRQSGLSFREIGRWFRQSAPETGAYGGSGAPDGTVARGRPQPDEPISAVFDHHIFVRALDTLGLGLAFFDRTGKLVHGNQALLQILAHGPDGGRLKDEMQSEVNLVLSKARLSRTGAVMEVSAREVREGDRCYRLKASHIGVHLFEPGSTVLISIEVVKASPVSEEILQARYHLTRQEANVAMMLVQGRSNRLISQALYISEHTARHHTQRVLEKLGLRSRSGIAARLLHLE